MVDFCLGDSKTPASVEEPLPKTPASKSRESSSGMLFTTLYRFFNDIFLKGEHLPVGLQQIQILWLLAIEVSQKRQ